MNPFRNKKHTALMLVFLSGAMSFYSCSTNNYNLPVKRAIGSIIANQPPLELGEGWTNRDAQNSDDIVQIIEKSLDDRTASSRLMKRDAHPKHHGCVKAFLQVDASALPKEQQVGVFSKNNQQEFKSFIRFSNGNPDSTKADKDGDVRGMAIKLMNIAGANSGSQDFLLMNSKTFFIKDSDEYLDFMKATENTAGLLWFLATHKRTREVILAARGMEVGNPLHIDYFSATPYKLGNKSVKYSARSCVTLNQRDTVPKNPSPNFLREKLVNTLSEKEACFDFFVQINTNPKTMPVEDPTVEWNEKDSPYIKVATIRIPKQSEIDSRPRMNFCENLSFDPWHTSLPEQRPLGAINRVRLLAYDVISKKRHIHNHMPQIEPTDHEACTGKTEVLCH
ncbi:MAG: catalase family protein [Bacteriovorax sp.]|nr:catalase family protein [Bacteriovorax sp.]